ncbi:MAG: ABC transporter substrate-binding protein [Deltaproteobacteria bacterium]|nr:ABC transporter substrate-binding protein [Deltaproteobacteria bacterium]
MKRSIQIIALISIGLFYQCAPKPLAPPVAVRMDEAHRRFEAAEQFFQKKDFQNAIKTYSAFLKEFPDHSLVPAALLKIGDIYAATGRSEKAQETYNRLITQYPQSPFYVAAMLGILQLHYDEGKYNEVIARAADIKEDRLSRSEAVRFLLLLADSHNAVSAIEEAVFSYARAFDRAGVSEKKLILPKLQSALQALDAEAIVRILARLEDAESRGYLLYRLGLLRARHQQYNEAVGALGELVEKFPDHEYAIEAEILLDEFKEMALYWSRKRIAYRRYTIGCMLPLSGPYATFGNRALKGIELALNQFSANEMNPPMTIIVKDTASELNRALQAVAELAEENVAAIIGPIKAAEAAAFEAQDRGIPIITLTQKDDITVIGDFVFRNFITPKMQVKTLVSYAVHHLDVDRFAILYPDEPFGKTYMNLFWDELLLNGGRVMGIESYDPAQTDFADSIKKLVGLYYEVPEELKEKHKPLFYSEQAFQEDQDLDTQLKPKTEEEPKPIIDFGAIFIPDAPKKAGLIIPQLAYHDVVDVHLLGTNLWHSDKLIEMAGQYLQGAIMADGFFSNSRSEAVQRFTKDFQEVYRKRPGFIEAITYDTAMMLFEIMRRPEIGSRSMLKDVLLKMKDYPGVTGSTSFNDDGDCEKRLYLLQVKGNRFVEVPYR